MSLLGTLSLLRSQANADRQVNGHKEPEGGSCSNMTSSYPVVYIIAQGHYIKHNIPHELLSDLPLYMPHLPNPRSGA
jgi:hypothetical protein